MSTESQKNKTLVLVAGRGDLESVQELLASKADLDFEDSKKGTALVAAIRNGRSEVVKLILDQYPDPQAKRLAILKRTSMGSAIQVLGTSNLETFILVLNCFEPGERLKIISEKNNMTVTQQNLFQAIASQGGQPEMLELALSYYPDNASRVKAILEEDINGNNAIYLAAEQPREITAISKVQLLLSHFPNPREMFIKEIEKNDFKLLFAVVDWNSPQKFAFLLSHYPSMTERLALLSKKNPQGHTPLFYAAETLQKYMVKYLLSEGCFALDPKEFMEFHAQSVINVQRQDKSNIIEIFKSLERVCSAGETEASELKYDIKHLGTALSARSPLPEHQGNTALHLAILNKNVELILMLLQNHAKTYIPNAAGKTPFDLAMEMDSEKQPLILGLINLFRALELKEELKSRQEARVKGREVKEQEEKLYTEQQMLTKNLRAAALASRSLLARTDLPKGWHADYYLKIADLLAPVDATDHLADPPIDAVGAYRALSKTPKDYPAHRVANLRMYELLSGAVALQSPAEKGQAPIPVPGSDIFEPPQGQETKTEKDKPRIVSLDEDDEAESEQPAAAKSIDKTLTREYKIRHLLYSCVKTGEKEFAMIDDESQAGLRQELFNLIAIYVYDLDMKPQLGEIMFNFIAKDKEARTPTTFMAMLELCRALAQINPHHDKLPTISPKLLQPDLAPAKPLVTQYKAGIQQPDTPGKPPASPRKKPKAP